MSGTTTAASLRRRAAGAGANRWVVLVVLCVSLLLVAVDATVLHVAVPAVTEDLKPGAVELLWIVDAYPLVCASLLILFGTLGDRVGRRRVLLLGYTLFGVASAMAAFADDAHLLILARALLGVGGAMIMPATLSILRQVFPDRRERALAIGVWSAVAAVGAAVGPLLGGFLLEHFWWGSVFLVNIPLMLVSLPVGRLLLPESKGDGDGPWDVVGALTAAAGLFAVVLGVKRLGAGELGAATLVPLAAGTVLLVLFSRRAAASRASAARPADVLPPRVQHLGGLHRARHARPGGAGADRGAVPPAGAGTVPAGDRAAAAAAHRRGHGRGPGGRPDAAPVRPAPHGLPRLLPDGRGGGTADRDGRRGQRAAAARRVRAARLRPGDHPVRRVRVDAQRGPAGTGRAGRRRSARRPTSSAPASASRCSAA